MRTVGVEEEFLLVDPEGRPIGVAGIAASGSKVQLELMEQMLETGTRPCADAAELADQLAKHRRTAARAARDAGAHLAALATSPLPTSASVTDDPRYRQMVAEFGLTGREQLTCGCHVHVEVADDEEGVAVLDRIGPWLPCLLAISANSPFWQGEDTGYASYRSQVWRRWPTAGPTAPFRSAAAYRSVVAGLIASGAALDEKMVYFDARLSSSYPTVEVRAADVCLRQQDALLLGIVVRALVETAARDRLTPVPEPGTRTQLLQAAAWRAGRSGVCGPLVHPLTLAQAPAAEVVEALFDQLEDVLTEQGEVDLVRELWSGLLARGSGAVEQRAWAPSGLREVLNRAGEATMAGCRPRRPRDTRRTGV